MGVSGSGKSTLGQALANKLGWDFFDADDFHSPQNIAKMKAGIPLNDSDRGPWLAALNEQLLSTLRSNRHPILACSALKVKYRARLLSDVEGIAVIQLKGSYDLILSRLSAREGHYMKAGMLQSQFDILEAPVGSLALEVSMSLDEMLDTIISKYTM